MPVQAITDNYTGQVMDAKANFGGNLIIYFGWDEHLMFCAPKAFPLPPQMTFGDVIDQIMPHLSTRNYIGIGIRGNHAVDSAGHCFNWHDSPAAVDATQEAVFDAIEEASIRFSIHPKRVILAGYQDGGTMAQRIALRTPSQISGVISMGGTLPHGELSLFEELRQRKLPMLWQWSSRNPLYNDQQIREDCQLAMSISADLEIRQYADEDEMNTVTLKDANDWIMRKVISGSSISDTNQWSSKSVAYSAN